MLRAPVRVNNAGSIWIVDQGGNRVALVDQVHKNRAEAFQDAQVIADAINHYLNNHTRRTDPQTSRAAELAMKDVLKNRYRKLAFEYFLSFGPMTDEQLCDKFSEAEVKLSNARVRHCRLELERNRMIIRLREPSTNRNGRRCTVFALRTSTTKGTNGKAHN